MGAFIANLSTRTQIVNLGTFDDTDVRPGFQGMAGLRFFLTRHVAVFGEYKYVRAPDFDFKLTSDVGTFNGATVVEVARFKLDLTTHMLQAGFAYHW